MNPTRIYNEKEREVIDCHRETYMNTSTPAQRKIIAQSKIFPELFTYWSSIGIVITPDEETRRTNVSFLLSLWKELLYLSSYN